MHSVRFYVHNSLPTDYFVESQDLQRCRELLAALEIATATKPLAIHNVYNHLNKLKVGPLLSYLDSCSGHSILLGDFNYHHEDWNGDQKTETSTSGKKFAEGVKAHNYILKTKKGAMTYSNSKDVSKRSSTIDLTFAKGSISASIGYCEVLQVPGFLSDHRVIETSVKRTVKTLVKTMPCWHKITPNKFQRHLKPRLPPLDSPVGNEEQVVALFAKVIDALHVTMMENVPRRSCGLRPQAQRTMQLASKLKKRLAELDDLKKKDQTPKTLKRILFLERDIDKLNTEMWSESDRDKIRPPSARAFFNVFRLARGRSQPLQFAQTPTLKYEGDSDAGNDPQLAVTDEQKIEMIKKVKFRNNNNPESTRILEEPGPRHDPKREDIHIPRDVDAEKLRTIIKGLKNNKAPGPDKVPNEAIKLGMELLLPYFVLGFRACLNLSLHPANFKDSIIVMLLKAGKEPDKPESYRPISLLSTVGKLYERILADMMLDVLKEHLNFLPATQFGNKTTAEALQYLFRIIFSTWCSNSDDVVTILGLDMSSAYDNVYRQKLLQTLYDKGFPMWFVDIIGLVLSLRDATIRLPGIISEPFELNTGIPLGSPISTVLFFFFVSPLVERTFPPRRIYVDGRKETVRLYQFSFVDDVYYIAVSRSYTINCRGLEILHEQMLSIAKELFINFGSHKYHVMHMRLPTVRQPTHNQVRPVIKGFVEEVQEKMTILGVIVDSQMTFDLHVTEITRKCRQRLGYMKRISGSTWGPDMYAIRQYYLTLIRPVITYACGAWFIKQREGVSTRLNFGLDKKVIGRLQSLQSECLRFVSGAFGCVAGTLVEKELFIENMWTILHSRASLQRAMSFTSHDPRWRYLSCGNGSSKARIRNPIEVLETEAGEILRDAVEYQIQLAQESDDPSYVQKMADLFADRKGRGKIVGSHIKWLAARDCQDVWQVYVGDRKDSQVAAGKSLSRLPVVALDESWGKQSLGYYKGMTRAQSTMLFQCRTEFIGLKYHLFRIQLGDAPYCRYNKSRETPFHLFVECTFLHIHRKDLFRKLQHTNFSTLLTVDGGVAAKWAISYFDTEQFDTVRKKFSTFRFDPSCISPREERISTSNSLQSTLPGQTMVSFANGITLLDSSGGTSTGPRRAIPTPLDEMLSHPSSLDQRPKATFLGLPLELRQQIYHEYFKVDGGYVHDSDSDKLTQADHQPISLSLRYACRSVAEETNTLVRFHTVLLSELLLRMRHFVAPEMFYEVEEVAPQYIKAIKWRINDCIGYDQHPELPPQDFEDVANFHNLGVLTREELDWNDITLGFQRAIVCTLRQINAKNAADIAEAINEALPGWTKSSSPEELFDMSFDHWDIPSLSCLRQTAKRLQRQRFLESLGNWHRVQDHDSGFLDSRYKGPRYRYRRKYWFSATAVAIRFLKRLSLTQRGYLHKLILNEDRISVGFPESHAIGMIPFCKENPKMHLEQRVDVWNNLVMSSERPTAYRLTNMYFERSEPEAGEYYSLYDVYAPDQDSYFTNWVVHGLEVVKAGMPARSWSVVFDGEPDLNLATDLFTTIIKRTIVWHTFYSDCVSLGLFTDPSHPEYPFATSTSDKRVPERMRSSIFQCNFNLDRPWNLDKIAADHNVHNDEHEGDLSFWLRSTVDDSEPIDFRISSPAVAIGKLRLVCFERETISDH
ncbi:hypothetical protein CEK26_007734 [Fusarium fujikuroi]|nr:hypothetical protein CEK26_007734 [Fusarium fujikuroi]